MDERDIFDKVMNLPLFKPMQPFYKKYKEGLLYLFFGGITFILAMAVYLWLSIVLGTNELIANIASWISGVTFSFFMTRKWVFRITTMRMAQLLMQIGEFYLARLSTLVLQEGLLFIFVMKLQNNGVVVKFITEIINIILNYLVSKFLIFGEKGK